MVGPTSIEGGFYLVINNTRINSVSQQGADIVFLAISANCWPIFKKNSVRSAVNLPQAYSDN